MKELNIEDKAKRYDKAINVAKSKIKNNKDHVLYEEDIIDIFPELSESDDEKARKEILNYIIKGSESFYDAQQYGKEKFEKWVAWLEKQGGKKLTLKSSNSDDVRRLMKQIMKEAEAYELNLPNRSYDIYAFAKDILAWIEKQDEQKSSDDENADITQKDFAPKIEPYIGGKFLA